MGVLSSIRDAVRRGLGYGPSDARGDLVATASHELRTPLAGMIGMAELLADTPLAPDQRSYVEAILASGRALAGIVDGLLDVARLDSGRREVVERPFDPRELLQSVVELLAPGAQRKGLEICCSVAPEVPRQIVGDPGRLRQVLLNLAGNGVKFTEEGGVAIAARAETGRLVVRVEDTGPGIPADRRAAIFQPFERAGLPESAPPGTGLGLAIARRQAEAMGGRLILEAGRPFGSVFTLELPLHPAPGVALSGEAEASDVLDGLSVVIVSDLPFEAPNLASALEEAGARASVLREPDTLDPAFGASRPPDVLIVDAALGGEVARRIVTAARAAGVQRCLVLVSPFAGRPDGDLLSAFDGWLVRPVRPASLFARVAPALRRDATPPPTPDPSCAPAALRDLHILVAEDDPVNGRLAQARLERLGARVTRVGDGEAAVAAIDAALAPHGPGLDAALLDIELPGRDGLAVARQARALEKGTGRTPMRLVALSARDQRDGGAAARAAGFDAVLVKPSDPAALADALAPVRAGVPTTGPP